MGKQVNLAKHILGPVCLGYNGHAYLIENNKPEKDLGRLFEVLPKNLARLQLSLSSKRSDPDVLFMTTIIQEALEMETANVTKTIYNKVKALSYFLQLYSVEDQRLKPSIYLLRIEKDLSQLNQLPKLKTVCKKLRVLAQLIEIGPVTKTLVKKEVRQIMADLVHLVNP